MSPRPDSKASILEAAVQIVDRNGAANLTIDAVAARAGLSKGGVLYHYPSKRKLLEGMLQLLLEQETRAASGHRAVLQGTPNAVLCSELLAARDALQDREQGTSLAILAAAAESPDLLEPARAHINALFHRLTADSPDGELALILLFAAEGIRFMDMLNLQPLGETELARVHDRLLALAQGRP
jgi:AcrR family transcriptional regulator